MAAKGRISKLAIGRKGPTSGSGGSDALGSEGSSISLIKMYSVTVDHASCAAVVSVSTSVTVTGITTNDVIIGCEPGAALTTGLVISNVRVSAANTVIITVTNVTAVAIDQASTTYKLIAMRVLAADM